MLPEFKSIFDLLKAFPDEQSCIDYLEERRWNGNVVSPFKSDSKVYKCSGNRYICKDTKKYFTVKVGTIFENTNMPLQKWFMALYILSSHKKGISSHQLAKDLDITQKSAWFMLHRLRYTFSHPNFKAAMGEENVVEMDETYVGGKEKNKHNSNKTGNTTGRSVESKTPVLGMRERDGIVVVQVVLDTTRTAIQPIIEETVIEGTTVITDE